MNESAFILSKACLQDGTVVKAGMYVWQDAFRCALEQDCQVLMVGRFQTVLLIPQKCIM